MNDPRRGVHGGEDGRQPAASRADSVSVMEEKAEEIRLLRRISRRREDALAELYSRYANPLYSLARKMVGNPQAAEEILQDAFVRIWKSAGSYDPAVSAPFSWAVMLTRRVAIDYLRSRHYRYDRQRETLEEDETGRRPGDLVVFPLPGDQAAYRDALRHTARLLERLSCEQQEVIQLAFFEGYTHSEIAHRLDMPVGTVKTHARRGMSRLRALLQQT